MSEYDIQLDTSGDGADDHPVVGVDFGAPTTDTFDGDRTALGLAARSVQAGLPRDAPLVTVTEPR